MADDASSLTELTATIVSNYVSHNRIETAKLGELIHDVHKALEAVGSPAAAEPEPDTKADKAAIRKSQSPDHLTSFIDGRKYKSLKRHLNTNGMSPDEYRTKFGLPKDYPMVAASYSAQRSELAKNLGLGRRAAAPEPEPAKAKAKPGPKAKAPKAIKPEEDSFT